MTIKRTRANKLMPPHFDRNIIKAFVGKDIRSPSNERVIEPPNLALLLTEVLRGAIEYSWYALTQDYIHHLSEQGDKHPVLVLPGLGAGDASTAPLREYLHKIGYASCPWNLGTNTGVHDDTREKLLKRLDQVYREYGEPVTLIGWSMGGVFAREMARDRPEKIRQVITLGSPIAGHMSGLNAHKLYKLLNGRHADDELYAALTQPISVPSTSIFSKWDGVVSWMCSVETPSPITQSIRLKLGSHLGLGYNPFVLHTISKLLPHTRETWKPVKFDYPINRFVEAYA